MLQLPEEGSARVVFPMGLATLTIVAAAVRCYSCRILLECVIIQGKFARKGYLSHADYCNFVIF